MEIFLTALSLVLVIEGAPYFLFPRGMKRWLKQIPEMPDSTLRIFGLGAMASGVLLLYAVRRFVG